MTLSGAPPAGWADASAPAILFGNGDRGHAVTRDDFINLLLLLRHARAGCWAFALYNQVAVREEVVAALRAQLAPLPVYQWTYSPHNPFPTSYLELIPPEQRSQRAVVFLFDFERAGEQVWKSLDYNREQFSAHPHGLVFWMTPAGRGYAARQAAHFWAQRSGVFDFTTDHPMQVGQMQALIESDLHLDSREEAERQLRLYLGLLEEAQSQSDAPPLWRAGLHGRISRLARHLAQYPIAQEQGEAALALFRASGDRAGEGTMLNNISLIYQAQGDYGRALGYLERSLAIRQEIGDRAGQGASLNNISQIYQAQGDYGRALGYLERALAIRQEIGDRAGEGVALNNISQIYRAQGDYGRALGYLERALAIAEAIGDRAGEGVALNNISQIYDAQGDYGRALGYLERALAIAEAIGDRAGEGTMLSNISQIYDAQGDYAGALGYLERALAIQQEIGDRAGEGTTLNNLAALAHAQGDYGRALGYLERALAIAEAIGDRAGLCATLFNLGHRYAQNEQMEEALAAWLRAYRIATEINLARVLQALADLAPQLGLPAGLAGWEELAQAMDRA